MLPCQLQPILAYFLFIPPCALGLGRIRPPLESGIWISRQDCMEFIRVLVLCEGRGSTHIIHRRIALPGPLPGALPILRRMEPTPRLELGTCRLRIGCSAN